MMNFKKSVISKYEIISLISKEGWKRERGTGHLNRPYSYKERFYKKFNKEKYKKIIPKLVALFKALNNGKPAATIVKDLKGPIQLTIVDIHLTELLNKAGYETTDELYKMGMVLKEGKEIPIFDILNSNVKKVRALDKMKKLYDETKNEQLKNKIDFYEGLMKAGLVDSEYKIDIKKLAISKKSPKLVFSYNHRAIGSQSTDVGWKSCMRLTGGKYQGLVGAGASAGVFICYLVKGSDQDPMAINNPTSRILFKPYIGKNTGDIIWKADRIYGTAPDNFKEYAQSLIDHIVKPKADIYYLTEKTYVDEIPRRVDTLNWEKMEDEDLLKIALDKKHSPAVRIQSVKLLKDQEFLKRIVLDDDENDEVRAEAVQKITDQKILEKLILDIKTPVAVKTEAIPLITDDKFINKMVSERIDKYLSYPILSAAIKKVTDLKVLDDLIWDKFTLGPVAQEATVRLGQISGTSKQLKQIAKNHHEDIVRYAALPFVHDQKELAEIALKHKSSRVLKMITDQKILEDILEEELKDRDRNIFFIRDLLDLVNNDDLLSKIALEEKDDRVRKFALQKIKNPSQEFLSKIALNDADAEIREIAIVKMDDQDSLKEIAKKDSYLDNRISALDKIEPDYEFLKKMALDEKEDDKMRFFALRYLHTKDLLTEKDQKWCSDLLFSRIEKAPNSIMLDTYISIIRSIVRDPEILYKMLFTSIGGDIIYDIEDDEMLKKVADNDEINPDVREKAVDQIKNKDILAQLIKSGSLDNKRYALQNKNIKDQELFSKIALDKSEDWRVQTQAVRRITKKSVLKQVANDPDLDPHVKQAASDKLESMSIPF